MFLIHETLSDKKKLENNARLQNLLFYMIMVFFCKKAIIMHSLLNK